MKVWLTRLFDTISPGLVVEKRFSGTDETNKQKMICLKL